MYWIGEIGEISAIVGRGEDFIQETPSVAHFRFKDRDCLGIIDYTTPRDADAEPLLSRGRVLRDPRHARHPVGHPLHRRDARPAAGDADQGTETTSYQVPMDWRTGFDGAARDFVDGCWRAGNPPRTSSPRRRSSRCRWRSTRPRARAGPWPGGHAMTTVETALGPVATDELGPTLMHEHIVTRSPGVQENWPHLWTEAPSSRSPSGRWPTSTPGVSAPSST